MNKNILKHSAVYSLVKSHVMFTFKRFYGEYIVNGKENIPTDVPVIFAANHTNALMDPLAVISALPKETQIVYLARSDYFRNKKMKNILLYFKILPAFRMREGIENIYKNYEVFDACVEVLNNRKPLGIMPEGNQGPQHRIRTLMKGIFRIAFSAQEKYKLKDGVKIVPVGVDYGSLENFGDHIIINIGKPIEVSEYMETYEENQVKAINELRDRLTEDMKNLTIHFSSSEYFNCYEAVSKAADAQSRSKTSMMNVFRRRQKIATKLSELEEQKPQLLEKLSKLTTRYNKNLDKLQLKPWVFNQKDHSAGKILLTALMLAFTFPVFLIGLICNFLPFFSPDFILKIFKINPPGAKGSLRFGLSLLTFPVFYLIQALIFFKKLKDNFLYLILLIPMQYIFGKLSFFWFRHFKTCMMKVRYRILKYNNSDLLKETESIHREVFDLIQA